MFFDRHNQKNSSEKEASGDITCTSCFGNNKVNPFVKTFFLKN